MLLLDGMDVRVQESLEVVYRVVTQHLDPIVLRVDKEVDREATRYINLDEIADIAKAELVEGLKDHVTLTKETLYNGRESISAEIIICKNKSKY